MNDSYIRQKMNDYLSQGRELLSAWLSERLPHISHDWLNECVLNKLGQAQRNKLADCDFADYDLAVLIRLASKNWTALRAVYDLSAGEGDTVRAMFGVRSNWYDQNGALPGKDIIIRDVEVLATFFDVISAPQTLLDDIDAFEQELENPGFSAYQPSEGELTATMGLPQTSDPIAEKTVVRLVGDPNETGVVLSVDHIGDTLQYQVFLGGLIRTFFDGQIEPVDATPKFHWVDLETFQSYLSAYQINNPSAGNLYSLNSARIDFVPYQFRPALKMIKADEPRILIADSVGVGKTIEAGLIIKELEARGELENIMIICPKPLVSERKWENEMKRFDEEFIPLTGGDLRRIIADTHEDSEWPARYNKTIVPYSILDSRVYDGEEGRYLGLSDLDPAPHFDLVIIDEAHHIRNGSMDKEKAYAFKCVKYFCDHADAVVMLTATPLQNGDNDLFTLLNILRPDIVLDQETFRVMSRPNAYISRASSLVRSAVEGWQRDAAEQLTQILATQWGENVIARNPLYGSIMDRLKAEEISREDRVRLITDIESLHSFHTMINRTRRKDIQDFCVRRSHTLESEFTPVQQELHDELLGFEQIALAKLHTVRAVPFMMSTIKRQAASCIFGLAPFMGDIINRRFEQLADDPEIDMDDSDDYEAAFYSLSGMAKRILELAENLPEEDPKFDSVLGIIQEKLAQENSKIMIFSTFRHTLAYIKKKLTALNIRVAQVDGSVKDEDRRILRERFKAPKEQKDALDILLFTEVGSEGLDYQFCDMMINYDLPWNPMRVEQRIGRIDRRGQKSEVVNIYNVITSGTVDADIYDRCLSRIGVFERSIGECEEILQQLGNQVERIAVDSKLTDEERRRKLEQIADNEVRKIQEMTRLEEAEKELFGFDLSSHIGSQEVQAAESPWLTPGSIQALVERYLNTRIGDGNYILGEGTVKTLRLNGNARRTLRADFAALPNSRNLVRRQWEGFLKGREPLHKITFEPEAAEREPNAFFITTVHPLVKQAARHFATSDSVYVSLRYQSDDLPEGIYPFSVYAWNYVGVNPHFKLVPICADQAVEEELNEIFYAAQAEDKQDTPDRKLWRTVEEKHMQLWQAEKVSHCQNARSVANFKLQSLETNYTSRQRILERRIQDMSGLSDRIARAHQSELDSATEKYLKDCEQIREGAARADVHITLIANGLIKIEGV